MHAACTYDIYDTDCCCISSLEKRGGLNNVLNNVLRAFNEKNPPHTPHVPQRWWFVPFDVFFRVVCANFSVCVCVCCLYLCTMVSLMSCLLDSAIEACLPSLTGCSTQPLSVLVCQWPCNCCCISWRYRRKHTSTCIVLFLTRRYVLNCALGGVMWYIVRMIVEFFVNILVFAHCFFYLFYRYLVAFVVYIYRCYICCAWYTCFFVSLLFFYFFISLFLSGYASGRAKGERRRRRRSKRSKRLGRDSSSGWAQLRGRLERERQRWTIAYVQQQRGLRDLDSCRQTHGRGGGTGSGTAAVLAVEYVMGRWPPRWVQFVIYAIIQHE